MDRKPNPWHALRVRARFENVVIANLSSRGFEVFLPTYFAHRQRRDRTTSIELPLFPGYVFCRIPSKPNHDMFMLPGVVDVAGCGAALDSWVENEVSALQSVVRSSLRYEAGPPLMNDLDVQVVDGPLRDVQGILVASSDNRLAVGVSLLRRSVLVDLPKGTKIVPLYGSGRAPVRVPA